MMVAKVDIHVIQLKKDYICAKTMVAKVDILVRTTQKEQYEKKTLHSNHHHHLSPTVNVNNITAVTDLILTNL